MIFRRSQRSVKVRLLSPVLLLSMFAWAGLVSADTRIALVIANADYGKFGEIPTPTKDARALAAKLSRLGFQVQQRANLERRDMKKTLSDFLRAAKLADKALIYYSGNQLSLDGKMYLIPVNEAPTSVNQARLGLVSVEAILRRFKTAAAENYFIIEGGWKTGIVTNLGGNLEKGAVTSLKSSQAVLVAPDNAVLAMATDGSAINPRERGNLSRFTANLVDALDERGATFLDVLEKAKAKTEEGTKGAQKPAIYGTFAKPVYLAGRPLVLPEKDGLVSEARSEWERIRSSNITDEFSAFLDRFEKTPFSGPALSRLHELQSEDPEHLKALRAQTLERRALLKLVEKEEEPYKEKQAALKKNPYSIDPINATYRINSNVAVRSKPSGLSEWAGLYKPGNEILVIGKVKGKSWFQVKLKNGKYGYFGSRYADRIGPDEHLVWKAIKKDPSEATLKAYLENFKDGFHRYPAASMLLELKYPDAKIGADIANEGYLEADGDLKGLRLTGNELPKATIRAASVQPTLRTSAAGPRLIKIPEMGYKLDVFEEEYIVKDRANLRRLPWIKTRRMAVANRDQKIVVTGKVREADWYRVKWGGGRDLYIYGPLVEPYSSSDFATWQEVKASGDETDLKFYLQSFPKGRFAKTATEMMKALSVGENGEEKKVVLPNAPLAVARLPEDSSVSINVVPITYNGEINENLSANIRFRLGNVLGTKLTSFKIPQDGTFMNVSGRILDVTIKGDTNRSFQPFDILLGDRGDGEETEQEAKTVEYSVVVELGASITGNDFPIITISEKSMVFPIETSSKVAIPLVLKRAFEGASKDILAKLDKVL